jgi:OmpR-family two-component system manganese-sensing response regulator
MPRILLVDDEVELTTPLTHALKKEGYDIDVATDGEVGSQLARDRTYDLLILDWMLPYRNGLDICQDLRSHGSTTPVLFLTAKDTIDDRVLGLDAGADDYLVKPFELRELLARVRALLRRPPQIEMPCQGNLQWGDLKLDCANQLAYRRGEAIELSDKEAKLLAYFMQSPNQLLTHAQLQDYLWDQNEKPSSNALAAQVKLLRRKIETPGEPPLIHSVYGKGYRFSNEAG